MHTFVGSNSVKCVFTKLTLDLLLLLLLPNYIYSLYYTLLREEEVEVEVEVEEASLVKVGSGVYSMY